MDSLSNDTIIMKIAVHQMNSGINMVANIENMIDAIKQAAANGAQYYFAPEMAIYLDRDRRRAANNILIEYEHPALIQLQVAARSNAIGLHIGSMPIRRVDRGSPYANRSYVINNRGEIISSYDKIHLFDVALSTGEIWCESNAYQAGDKAVVVDIDTGKQGICKLGLSICYDIRFAALYHRLSEAGAQIGAIPAAFTVPTGQAHWHILLRARAIENAMFIVAAAQCGTHEDGRQTYGHSLVVDPWGRVLLDMGTEIGIGYADINMAHLEEVRAQLPVMNHRKNIDPIIFS